MTELSINSTPLEVRKAWAERLRNPGDIVQGINALAPSEKERCCLGVLCDLAVEAGVIRDYLAYDGVPPDSVDLWAGFPMTDSYSAGVTGISGSLPTLDLTTLNDVHGFTFADIADLLDDGLVLGPDGEVLQ